MKVTVKIGEVFARVGVSPDTLPSVVDDIVRHVEGCPQCAALVYAKGKKKR